MAKREIELGRTFAIDSHYYDFQFAGQGFFGFENGRSAGQLRGMPTSDVTPSNVAPTPSTVWRPFALATRPGTSPTTIVHNQSIQFRCVDWGAMVERDAEAIWRRIALVLWNVEPLYHGGDT